MMRTLVSVLAFILSGFSLRAQDYGLYWKYKDYDGAIAATVPAWAIHIGTWFIEDREERKLAQKVGKVRVLFFEDGSPITPRDTRRFARKAKRRGLEELLTVRDGKTHVKVMAKERRNGKGIRKVVVFVDSPDGFALVSVRGRLRYDDLKKVLDEYGSDKKPGKDQKGGEDPLFKIPVSKS